LGPVIIQSRSSQWKLSGAGAIDLTVKCVGGKKRKNYNPVAIPWILLFILLSRAYAEGIYSPS